MLVGLVYVSVIFIRLIIAAKAINVCSQCQDHYGRFDIAFTQLKLPVSYRRESEEELADGISRHFIP